MHEAISTVNEDIDQSILNYMLYYVLIRSKDHEQMEYKNLITLLDSLIQSQSRSQSASRKNRPESSSPDKLKMRNPTKVVNDDKEGVKSSDDNYSDEEIANDPDENEESEMRNND